MDETRLAVLEKTGSADVQELVAEVRQRGEAAESVYRTAYDCGKRDGEQAAERDRLALREALEAVAARAHAALSGTTSDATACKCVPLDAAAGGGTDPRSCPEHAYYAGRRHERLVYLEERDGWSAQIDAVRAELAIAARDRDGWNTWAERYKLALTEIQSRAAPPRQFAVFGLDAAERTQERARRCEEIVRLAVDALNWASGTGG